MSIIRPELSTRAALGWIALAVALAHGLLPFCTLIVSDDWFTLLAYREASARAAWEGAVFLSMPLTVLQALPFFLVGDNVFVLRLINFAVVILLGWTTFLSISRLVPERREEVFWIAVISVVFPGYKVHFMLSFLFYQVGLTLFLGGLWLALLAEAESRNHRRRLLLALSAAAVFYSFHCGALLVFHVFFVAAHFVGRMRQSRQNLWTAAQEYLVRRYVFLLLPLWFWGAREAVGLLLPTWSEYNQPRFNPLVLTLGARRFGAAYLEAVRSVIVTWWFAGGLLMAGLVLMRRRTSWSDSRRWLDGLGVLLGVLVLIAGAIPFIMVGKFPHADVVDPSRLTAFGLAIEQILQVIDTRMHLFLGLSIGFILVAGLRLLRCPRELAVAVWLAFSAASVVVCVRWYAEMEGRAAIMAGVREQFRRDPQLARAHIIGVVDRVGLTGLTWDSWPLFLETVWGDRQHHGVPERWWSSELNRRIVYHPSTIVNSRLYGGAWSKYLQPPPVGANQATVVCLPGPGFETIQQRDSLARMIYQRLFDRPGYAMSAAELVRIRVIPKINLERMVAAEDFGRFWVDLQPESRAEGDPIEVRGATNLARAAPGGALTIPWKLTPTLSRHLLIDVASSDQALPPDAFQLSTETGAEVAFFLLRRDLGVRLLVVAPGTEGVLTLESDVLPPGSWHVERVRQQPLRDSEMFALLPEPFFTPAEIYPEQFLGAYSVAASEAPEILFRARTQPRPTFTTDVVPIQSGLPLVVMIEQAESSDSTGLLLLQDQNRQELLALPLGKSQVSVVPLDGGSTGVQAVLMMDTEPAALPSLTLVQSPPFASLEVPLDEHVSSRIMRPSPNK